MEESCSVRRVNPGDVGRHQGPGHLARRLVRTGGDPFGGQTGHVGTQRSQLGLGRRFGSHCQCDSLLSVTLRVRAIISA